MAREQISRGEAHHRSGGVSAQGFVNEVLEFGEFHDFVEELKGSFSAEPDQGRIKAYVLGSGEVKLEAGSQVQQRGDPSSDVNRSGVGCRQAAHETEESALPRPIGSNDRYGFEHSPQSRVRP